jgi:hypothetical protein
MEVDEGRIRERAHRLWEHAGRPDGQEEHFWLEAERRLKEEQIRHEPKTPDMFGTLCYTQTPMLMFYLSAIFLDAYFSAVSAAMMPRDVSSPPVKPKNQQ